MELVIALAVGAILLAAMFGVFTVQHRSLNVEDQVAELQQNVRAGMDMMVREIRMAGFDPTGTLAASLTALGENVITVETVSTNHDRITFYYIEGTAPKKVVYEIYSSSGVPNLGRRVDSGSIQPVVENMDGLTITYDAIATITISLTGRTGEPDPRYTHPVHSDHYRRYTLDTTVVCRNLALSAAPSSTTTTTTTSSTTTTAATTTTTTAPTTTTTTAPTTTTTVTPTTTTEAVTTTTTTTTTTDGAGATTTTEESTTTSTTTTTTTTTSTTTTTLAPPALNVALTACKKNTGNNYVYMKATVTSATDGSAVAGCTVTWSIGGTSGTLSDKGGGDYGGGSSSDCGIGSDCAVTSSKMSGTCTVTVTASKAGYTGGSDSATVP